MEFDVRTSRRGAWTVIAARGELDLYTVALLKDELSPVIESQSLLIFDFTNLRYLDSSAIGAVVGAFRKMSEKGGCARIACSEPVRRVFESVGLDKQINIYPSLSQAAALRPESTGPGDDHPRKA